MSHHSTAARLTAADHRRLYRQAQAARWRLDPSRFAAAIEHSVERGAPDGADAAAYANALHLEDLALACACAAGDEGAWDHFVREFRPALYRAADALDATGGAREMADSLYGELFGLQERDGERRSHFAYYHGRSSLATWLRAVLSQRLVDRARARQRFDPLPDDPPGAAIAAADPERGRLAALVQQLLLLAIAALTPKDRLRLACYYGRQLTLAETGRVLGEHEATVSRQIAKLRKSLRADVEQRLRARGMDVETVATCFEAAAGDPGAFDLNAIVSGLDRKNPAAERS